MPTGESPANLSAGIGFLNAPICTRNINPSGNFSSTGIGFVFEYAVNTGGLTGGDQIRINGKMYGRYDGNAEQFASTPLDTLERHANIIRRIGDGQGMPAVNHTVGMTDIKISPYAGEVMKILGINYGQGVMTGLSGLDKVQVILAKPENIAVELYAYLLQNKLVACLKEQVIDSQGRARNVVKAYDVTNTDNGLSMKPADIHIKEKCFK